MSKHGYFNFDFTPAMASSLEHTLNRRYKGSQRYGFTAPDAQGELFVWARCAEEAKDHIYNALFDLIFQRSRCGAAVQNPPCIYCGHRTESRGRNSSGTRGWRCLSVECQRSFVVDRTFRGGINHPSQSKKPAFHQMVFVEGKTVREACDALCISAGAARNWFSKMSAVHAGVLANCPCGKQLRHRGTCRFRQQYARSRHVITRPHVDEAR